jgi:hypothetical protein
MSNFHLHFDLKLLKSYHATKYLTKSWLDPSFSCTCNGYVFATTWTHKITKIAVTNVVGLNNNCIVVQNDG